MPGRPAVWAGLLAISVTAAAGHAQQIGAKGYEPPLYSDGQVHSEKSEVRFGAFSVVRTVEDYRAAPIIEGPWLTKEATLAWHDSSGRVGFDFVDDGASIKFTPRARSVDGLTTCIVPNVMVGYDPAPATTDNWRRLRPFIIRELRACSTVVSADLNRVAAELEAAVDDYLVAGNAWKGVSRDLFGAGGRRCIAERMERPFTIPPRFRCTRYSK